MLEERSRITHETYRQVVFTLQGIVQATVFAFVAVNFSEYVAAEHGTAGSAIWSNAFWRSTTTWHYAISLTLIVVVLAEYVSYASVISRVPKVRDIGIIIAMGFLQTWMALVANEPADFWLISGLFFIPVFAIYSNTLTMPMLDPADNTNERKKLLKSHIRKQVISTTISCLFCFSMFFALTNLDFGENTILAATLAYLVVAGSLMTLSTGRFTRAWFAK